MATAAVLTNPAKNPVEQLRQALVGIWPKFESSIRWRIELIKGALEEGVYDGMLGPREEAYMAAHNLAGEFGAFGFEQLARTARKMEQLLAPNERVGLAEAEMLDILCAQLHIGFSSLKIEVTSRKMESSSIRDAAREIPFSAAM